MSNEELRNLLVYKKPATIAVIFLLVLAIFPWSYGYYVFLRWVVFLVSGFLVYLAHNLKKTIWVVMFTLIAILFNPIVRISLDRETWQVIDLVTASIFIFSFFQVRNAKSEYD